MKGSIPPLEDDSDSTSTFKKQPSILDNKSEQPYTINNHHRNNKSQIYGNASSWTQIPLNTDNNGSYVSSKQREDQPILHHTKNNKSNIHRNSESWVEIPLSTMISEAIEKQTPTKEQKGILNPLPASKRKESLIHRNSSSWTTIPQTHEQTGQLLPSPQKAVIIQSNGQSDKKQSGIGHKVAQKQNMQNSTASLVGTKAQVESSKNPSKIAQVEQNSLLQKSSKIQSNNQRSPSIDKTNDHHKKQLENSPNQQHMSNNPLSKSIQLRFNSPSQKNSVAHLNQQNEEQGTYKLMKKDGNASSNQTVAQDLRIPKDELRSHREANKSILQMFFQRNEQIIQDLFAKAPIHGHSFVDAIEQFIGLFKQDGLEIEEHSAEMMKKSIFENDNILPVLKPIWIDCLTAKNRLQDKQTDNVMSSDDIKDFFSHWLSTRPNIAIVNKDQTRSAQREISQKFASFLQKNIERIEDIQDELRIAIKNNKSIHHSELEIVTQTIQFLKTQQKKISAYSQQSSIMQSIEELSSSSKVIAKIEKDIKYIYREYALGRSISYHQNNQSLLSDDLVDVSLNINNFFRLVKDLELASTKHLSGTLLIEMFHKHSTEKSMNYSQFFQALLHIVEIQTAHNFYQPKDQIIAVAKLLRISVHKAMPHPQKPYVRTVAAKPNSNNLSDESIQNNEGSHSNLPDSDQNQSQPQIIQSTNNTASNSRITLKNTVQKQPISKIIPTESRVNQKALSSSPRAKRLQYQYPYTTKATGQDALNTNNDRQQIERSPVKLIQVVKDAQTASNNLYTEEPEVKPQYSSKLKNHPAELRRFKQPIGLNKKENANQINDASNQNQVRIIEANNLPLLAQKNQ